MGQNIDVSTHFTPGYKPWDQRLCIIPDGDLFDAIRDERASLVTDHIECFTPSGIRLRSGNEIEADLIITATGLRLQFLGGAALQIDDWRPKPAELMTYKGMMLSGVPNLMFAVGYTNASWTLKVDLTCGYACRLLNHLEKHGHRYCVPRPDPSMPVEPIIDFSSGYVKRALHRLPRGGSKKPWKLYQNYALDTLALRFSRLDDGVMDFVS